MAKIQIQGKIGVLFVIELIIYLVTYAANIIPGVGQVLSLAVGGAFSLSLAYIYLGITCGGTAKVGDAFKGFDQLWLSVKANILVGLLTVLWSLLFVIPGIIKAIEYSQVFYIISENPGIGAREAINRSKTMMQGHRMDFFILTISFVGWMLLGTITCGIALIWVVPYMNATFANFYNDIK